MHACRYVQQNLPACRGHACMHAGTYLHACMQASTPACRGARAPAGGSHSYSALDVASMITHEYSFFICSRYIVTNTCARFLNYISIAASMHM